MIVLDTNVISELEGRTHSERILAWLDDYAIERIFLTTITVGEVRYGIALLPEGKRRQQLASTFDRIEAAFSGRILDFSLDAAHLYATISAARKCRTLHRNQGRHDRRDLPLAWRNAGDAQHERLRGA